MSRYDGLIIPRSYSEYINKTDAATLLQALQLSGVMDAAPTAGSNHPAKSGGLYNAILEKLNKNNVATEYVNTNIYSVGQYVIKDNILYRCILNKYLNQGWDGHFEQVLLSNLGWKDIPRKTTPSMGTGSKTFVFDISIITQSSLNFLVIDIGGSNQANEVLLLGSFFVYTNKVIELGKTSNITYSITFNENTKELTVTSTQGYYELIAKMLTI